MDTTNFGKSKILVVDDEPAGREVLYGLLTVDGYIVELAQNGSEALQKAAVATPDLILLDVMMPDIDGFEVCRQLRENPDLAEVPVIMLTALDDRDSLLEGIEAGADDFISKPFDRQELRARVRTVTRLNRFRRLVTERNKFQWVIDHADDGYVVIDNSGKIQYANKQARLYLNLPTNPTTTITQPFQNIVKQQFRREPKAAWGTKKILSPSPNDIASPRYLVRPETPTAHSFWLQVDFLPTSNTPAAQPTDWVIRLRDVTAKMLMQRDMWQFQAMIAHKLRAPIVPVVGTAELLASEIDHFTKDEIALLIGRALNGISRLRQTVEDIIRFSDITQTVPVSRLNGFALKNLKLMLDELGAALEIENITLSGENFDDTKLALPHETLNTIMRELLLNAKKFHPRQTPNITVSVSAKTADTITLALMDDGVSLSPEQLKYIWTPYYQGEKFFTGESSGIGLGLPMVASLVWSINGECLAYNRDPAPGVVIELQIPVQQNSHGAHTND